MTVSVPNATKAWKEIRQPAFTQPVWVRHDAHDHVDFGIRCGHDKAVHVKQHVRTKGRYLCFYLTERRKQAILLNVVVRLFPNGA